jgi:uncharacterized protein YgbK (DUF1537 family)
LGDTLLDIDTRDASSATAQQRVRRAMASAERGDAIFKKIDSTLRGNLASELRAVLACRPADCVIAAPAFPATGRTTVDGRQLIGGRPLEESEFSEQVSSSVLRDLLAPAGQPVSEVTLAEIRGGRLGQRIADASARPAQVLVCDAETEADLDQVARAGMDSGCEVVWLGSAGLARRLAAILPPPARAGGRGELGGAVPVLLVVGSPASSTQAQLRRLRELPELAEVVVAAEEVVTAGEDLGWAIDSVRDRLGSGRDCVLSLEGNGGRRDHRRAGTRALAAVAASAGELIGGLVLTGGETARAVLEAMSVRAVKLAREIQPGIPLGFAQRCPRPVAVSVKAGDFGSEDALAACWRAMRDSDAAPQQGDER